MTKNETVYSLKRLKNIFVSKKHLVSKSFRAEKPKEKNFWKNKQEFLVDYRKERIFEFDQTKSVGFVGFDLIDVFFRTMLFFQSIFYIRRRVTDGKPHLITAKEEFKWGIVTSVKVRAIRVDHQFVLFRQWIQEIGVFLTRNAIIGKSPVNPFKKLEKIRKKIRYLNSNP